MKTLSGGTRLNNVSEILQLIEIKRILLGLISCPALGIMEWWNNGMLILRERYSFMNFAVKWSFANNCQ
jgi:hypothetical protein